MARVLPALCLAVFVGGLWAYPSAPVKKKIDFNRDIRPVIDKCIACHGHDPKAVMAGLRIDDRASVVAALKDGKRAIVPGHPESSELVRRVMSDDPDEQMPPPSSKKVLSADE